jgi:hypothetical protein
MITPKSVGPRSLRIWFDRRSLLNQRDRSLHLLLPDRLLVWDVHGQVCVDNHANSPVLVDCNLSMVIGRFLVTPRNV